jgi:predicted ATPase
VTAGAPRVQLVGRDAAVAGALAALEDARLVTLTGPDGVGRTRLAAAVAAAFPGGGTVASVAPLTSDHVAQAIATAAGVTERPGQPLEQALAERFGRGRRLLVVDGCEHLPEAAAGLLGRLLAACPELAVLATARG